jgi:hypothetical protein
MLLGRVPDNDATPGISSVQFQRQLGLMRNQTAFTMLHKLRSAMVRFDRDKIGASIRLKLTNAMSAVRREGKAVVFII